MPSEPSAASGRVPKGMCGICLGSVPKDQMRERGGDLLCGPCYEMAEKRSRAQPPPPAPEADPQGVGAAASEQATATPGLSAEEERKLRRALHWLLQQVNQRPDDTASLVEMIEIHEKLGERQQAAVCRLQLSRIDPGHPSLRDEEGPRHWRASGRKDFLAEEVGPSGQRDSREREREAPEEEEVPPVPFWMDIPGVLGYPFQGRGRAMFLTGGIFFGATMTIARMSAFMMVLAILGAILSLATFSYLTSYWFRVIQASASGSPEPPEWPDFSDAWNAFISPIFTIAVLGLVPFAPFVVLSALGGSVPVVILQILAALGGIFVFPMVLLIYSMFHSVADALNPGLIVSSIKRVLADYFILFVTLSLLFGAYNVAKDLLTLFGTLLGLKSGVIIGVFVYSMATSFLQIYTFMVASNLIGSLYRQGKGRLGWFGEPTEPPRPLTPEVIRGVVGAVAAVLVLGVVGALLTGGGASSHAGGFPIPDGFHLDYQVRYQPAGGYPEEYYVRYRFAKVPEGFKVTATRGEEPTPFTEFTIDPKGNFVGEPPKQDDPFLFPIDRGPAGSERTQSIIWGPTKVDDGDPYRNGYPMTGLLLRDSGFYYAMEDPYLKGTLYYQYEKGFLDSIDLSGEGSDLPICSLKGSGVETPEGR